MMRVVIYDDAGRVLTSRRLKDRPLDDGATSVSVHHAAGATGDEALRVLREREAVRAKVEQELRASI